MKTLFKYLLRFFAWTGIGLFLLILLVFFLVQTPAAKKFILRTALEQVNHRLNGKITATTLAGNFFTNLKLSEIQVQTETDTLLRLASLEVHYNPLSFLTRQFQIDRVQLGTPEIAICRTLDGWNFVNLFPASSDTVTQPQSDTTDGISVQISKILLQNGKFTLRDQQTIIPGAQSRNIFLDATAHYAADSLSATVNRFDWQGKIACLELNHFFFQGEMRGEQLVIDSLKIVSDSSAVAINGSLSLSPDLDFNLHFFAQPLVRSDLLKLTLDIPAYPVNRISGQLFGNVKQFQTLLNLEFQQEKIQLAAQISLEPEESFDATITTRHLNLQSIQGLDLPPSDLFLKLHLTGKNFHPDSLQTFARLALTAPGSINRQPIRQLAARFDFQNQILKTGFTLALSQVSAQISGRLNLASPLPAYEFKIALAGPIAYELLDLGAADDQLEFHGLVAGCGFKPEEMSVRAEIFARKIQVQGIQADSLFARVNFSNAQVDIDSILLNSPFGILGASGTASLRDSLVSANYQITDLNLATLPVSLAGDSLAGTGSMTGTLEGRLDSLFTSGQMALVKAAYGTNKINHLALNYDVLLTDSLPQIGVEILATGISLDSFKIDSVRGNTRLLGNRIDTHARAAIDTLGNLETDFSLELGDSLLFTFHRLNLNVLDYHFSNASRPFFVTIQDEKISVDMLELTEANQRLALHGWIHPAGTQAIDLEIENLDLSRLGQISPLPISGIFSTTAQLGGSFRQPDAAVSAQILNPLIGGHHFENLSVRAEMHANRASLTLALKDLNLENIIDFSSVMNFLPDTSLAWQERFVDFPEISLQISSLQLALLNDFLQDQTKLKGRINVNLIIQNILTDFSGRGHFVLNGDVNSPAMGIDYKNVLLKFELDGKNLVLDNFSIFTQKGWLKGQGKIGLSKNFDSPFTINFSAKNFEAVNSKLAQATLNADFDIFGSVQRPEYKGKIELQRSRINLPPFLKLTPTEQTLTEPEPVLLTPGIQPDSAASPALANLMLNDLRGTLSLVIPRNTWLRNEEINIELSGELELIKKSADFALFGPVRVVRGNVQFYGKKFTIEKGELIFRGLYPPDPEIYILASFRHPDVMIQLLIGGSATEPQLSLQSSPEIEQRDIFSYLLFGKPFAFLSGEERDDLGGENALLTNAMGIAVGMLAGELTRAVAKQLQLDIIEFSQGSDWQSSTLKVGKYVGKGMFVFYSRDLVGTHESVSLEYQINQNWLLKADQSTAGTGGVDLWWQKEW